MFKHDFSKSIKAYTNVLLYDESLYIRQLQNEKMKFIFYDFIIFENTQRNYHTYKRKLYVMIQFVIKYRHMFNAKKTFIFHIDHKLFVKFINALKHENIYVRWINKLKNLNVTIKHIKNKKNQIVDDLFKIIFNETNCKFDQFVKKFYFEIKVHENDIE